MGLATLHIKDGYLVDNILMLYYHYIASLRQNPYKHWKVLRLSLVSNWHRQFAVLQQFHTTVKKYQYWLDFTNILSIFTKCNDLKISHLKWHGSFVSTASQTFIKKLLGKLIFIVSWRKTNSYFDSWSRSTSLWWTITTLNRTQ